MYAGRKFLENEQVSPSNSCGRKVGNLEMMPREFVGFGVMKKLVAKKGGQG